MPKNTSSFTTVVNAFKALLTKDKISSATTKDLLLLKSVLELGIKVLNEQVDLLSGISISNNKSQPKYNNTYRNSNINHNSPPPIQTTELGLLQPITGFEIGGAVSLYDAETEARMSNEQFLNSVSPNEPLEDEVEKLEEIFSSIKDEE